MPTDKIFIFRYFQPGRFIGTLFALLRNMEMYYETPGSIDEALEMLAAKRAIFIDMEDAIAILKKHPRESYKLHWNSPVQGRVVIIPEHGNSKGDIVLVHP